MVILVIVCVIIIAILFFLYSSLRRDVKSLRHQLNYTLEEKSTFTLYTTSSDAQVKELVKDINSLRLSYQSQRDHYMEMDGNFKGMITNISHDIRTPLTSIKGYLQMLETCDEKDFDRYYDIISQRILYLQELLESLFLYTKITNDALEYHMEVIDVYDELCENSMPFYQQFQEAKIKVQMAQCQERIHIVADTMCLQRIFANLFSNALKYAISYLDITIAVHDSQVFLYFRNDCKNEVDVNALFERFYTGDHARSHANTGLGLAIVKELVENLHGNVKGDMIKDALCITLSFPISKG